MKYCQSVFFYTYYRVLSKRYFCDTYDVCHFQTLIRILASPIHPADINTIQGVYAVKPALPAVGGLDCFADVLEVSASL